MKSARTFAQIEDDLKTAWQMHTAGRLAEAEAVYRAAVAEGHNSLSLAMLMAELLKNTDRGPEAVDWYRKAVQLAPAGLPIADGLGALLADLGRFDEAMEVLDRALLQTPKAPNILQARGNVLARMGRPAEGLEYLMRAVELAPRDWNIRAACGNALLQMRRFQDAEAQYRAGLALKPDDVSLLNSLGATCRWLGKLGEAERCFRRAIELAPDYPEALANLGGLLRHAGRIQEAKNLLRKALALRSPWPGIHSNLIFCLDFDGESSLKEQRAERQRWHLAIEKPLAQHRYRHRPSSDPDKRLRIGYVSADFRVHSASDMFGGVLLNHDLERHDVLLYSSTDDEDERTAAFAGHATAFHRVRGLSDEALAARIHDDRIDILVDLSGHSAGNRLPAFARKPAPVQVTAWGYATGTGLRTIDYFLADRRLVPEELRSQFSETIVELPCFLTYRPPAYLPAPGPLPMATRREVTFGCLNRLSKASDECLATWAALLRRVPNSRLILKCTSLADHNVRARIIKLFGTHGVQSYRLDLRQATSHEAHLLTYREIDIALDPFPHCGGTSTCEALMMGLPVVSLCGQVPVARNGYALLGAAGLEEWVAWDPDTYIAKAATLAKNPEQLSRLRRSLRELFSRSPIGDNAAYVRAVEALYRTIWMTHCKSGDFTPIG
ncbi:tetratricopeptide repeat protein [Marinibaculum pumilum]|uniref:protein O-GlcNAc transferase n=1 Tax=Marinibaculum pumilum TaxID=1766165 RepID=A0ABV7L6X0_9PROT